MMPFNAGKALSPPKAPWKCTCCVFLLQSLPHNRFTFILGSPAQGLAKCQEICPRPPVLQKATYPSQVPKVQPFPSP